MSGWCRNFFPNNDCSVCSERLHYFILLFLQILIITKRATQWVNGFIWAERFIVHIDGFLWMVIIIFFRSIFLLNRIRIVISKWVHHLLKLNNWSSCNIPLISIRVSISRDPWITNINGVTNDHLLLDFLIL